jgi:hypothetical protein
MSGRALDVVQSLACCDQNLLRRAAAVGTGAAKIAGLDHRDREAGPTDWVSHTDADIAAAQDYHIECFAGIGRVSNAG